MSFIVSTIQLEAITRPKKPCGINYIEVILKDIFSFREAERLMKRRQPIPDIIISQIKVILMEDAKNVFFCFFAFLVNPVLVRGRF